jgi:TonB family protein
MFDPSPHSPNSSNQYRQGFIASILLIVVLVHGILLGFIWKHHTQVPERKIRSTPPVSYFEYVMHQSENKEAVSTQAASSFPKIETLKEITPLPSESLDVSKNAQVLKPVSLKPVPWQTLPQTAKNQSSAIAKKTVESNTDNEIPPLGNVSYLNNPHPTYPKKSRRLNEQGKVILGVEVDLDGTVSQIKISLTSGYPRLDRSAIETVRSWRFIVGKKSGVPQKMWVNIPINFVLE